MSKIELDWDRVIDKVEFKVGAGIEAALADIQRSAIMRAPVRKAFQSRKKATKHDLADFSMKVGRTDRYTGGQLREAAAMIGIDLDVAQAKALSRGRTLEVQTSRSGGPNRLSFRGRHEARTVSVPTKGINEATGKPGARNKRAYSRVIGRDLRQVTPRRSIGGRLIGFEPNVGRLKKHGVKLTPAARYDIRHASSTSIGAFSNVRSHATSRRGVMSSGGRHQYGGFLRKHITMRPPERVGNRIVGSVVSEAPYSRYVEFPTSRTAAQPYLMPALKAARGRLKEYIKRG